MGRLSVDAISERSSMIMVRHLKIRTCIHLHVVAIRVPREHLAKDRTTFLIEPGTSDLLYTI